jgi:hypothetical protein
LAITGGSKQKGIVHWGLSANRQNPFAGAASDAVFNTFRRTKGQIFFWLPPLIGAYYLMSWAVDKYVVFTTRLIITHGQCLQSSRADNCAGTTISTPRLDELRLLRTPRSRRRDNVLDGI